MQNFGFLKNTVKSDKNTVKSDERTRLVDNQPQVYTESDIPMAYQQHLKPPQNDVAVNVDEGPSSLQSPRNPADPVENYQPPFNHLDIVVWDRLISNLQYEQDMKTGEFVRLRDRSEIIKDINHLKLVNKAIKGKVIDYLNKDHKKDGLRKAFATNIRNNKLKKVKNKVCELLTLRTIFGAAISIAIPSLMLNVFQVARYESMKLYAEIGQLQNWTFTTEMANGIRYDYVKYTLQSPEVCQYSRYVNENNIGPNFSTISLNSSAPAGFWFAMFFTYAIAVFLIHLAAYSLTTNSKIKKTIAHLSAAAYVGFTLFLPKIIDVDAWAESYTHNDFCGGFWNTALNYKQKYLPEIIDKIIGGPFMVSNVNELLFDFPASRAVIPEIATPYGLFLVAGIGVFVTACMAYGPSAWELIQTYMANLAGGFNPGADPEYFEQHDEEDPNPAQHNNNL